MPYNIHMEIKWAILHLIIIVISLFKTAIYFNIYYIFSRTWINRQTLIVIHIGRNSMY